MIEIKNLQKSFDQEQVLNGLALELSEKATLSILGKSGCGKSTLLKVMAGLETPDAGSFTVDQKDMFALPPQKRGVVYLSQEPLLFPHLSVANNLAFGLTIRKVGKKEVDKRVGEMAEKIGLSAHLDKKPHQLSGGQKQRASFGRALIINPRIVLLDEPFGSLDAQTREEMQQLFQDIRKEFSITALFVTHDLKEALIMADRIAKMQEGRLKVYASLEEFISSPESGADKEISFWKKYTLSDHRL